MADWNDLKAFVGSSAADDTFVQQCWTTASALVDAFVGTNTVPSTVLDLAYVRCGSELFFARQAPNGIAQFQGFDGAPVRIARDPMVAVYSLLSPFMVVGL